MSVFDVVYNSESVDIKFTQIRGGKLEKIKGIDFYR